LIIEDVQTGVLRVGHDEIAEAVKGDAGGVFKFAGATSFGPEMSYVSTVEIADENLIQA